jgi:glycosyltransferase involved in cell wall biosynthesis
MQIDLDKYIKKNVEHFPHQMQNVKPVVSVCVQTYNHGVYIKECLDGIIRQKTDFPIEILLGEDESDDGTRDICVEYAEKYPGKIRLFLHSRKNVMHINGRPTGRFNLLYNLHNARGKYIALCEGDDYWTDPFKLQKQVDFLEANPDYAICFHNVFIDEGNGSSKPFFAKSRENPENGPLPPRPITTIMDMAMGNYIYTTSAVHRNYHLNDDLVLLEKTKVGDWPLHMLNARKGKIRYLPDIMAAYRKHGGGVWSSQNTTDIIIGGIITLKAMLAYRGFDDDVKSALRQSIGRYLEKALSLKMDESERQNLFRLINPLLQNDDQILNIALEHLSDAMVKKHSELIKTQNELFWTKKKLSSLKASSSYRFGRVAFFPARLFRHTLKKIFMV